MPPRTAPFRGESRHNYHDTLHCQVPTLWLSSFRPVPPRTASFRGESHRNYHGTLHCQVPVQELSEIRLVPLHIYPWYGRLYLNYHNILHFLGLFGLTLGAGQAILHSACRYAIPQRANTTMNPMHPDRIAIGRQFLFREDPAEERSLFLAEWKYISGCRPKLWKNLSCRRPKLLKNLPCRRPKLWKNLSCSRPEMFYFLPVPLQRRPAICCTVFWLPPDSSFPSESWHSMSMPVWPSYRRIRYCVLKMRRICSRSPRLSLSVFRCHTPSSKAVSILCLPETFRHYRSDSPSRRGRCQQNR